MGQDRPGIVATVSGALVELGCNVEDVATSILRGHFSMMMVVAAGDLELSKLNSRLQGMSDDDLAFAVWEVQGSLETVEATHVLTVYGRDTTGILHAVSSALSEAQVNICDMVCRLHEGEDPVYVVTMEVALPEGADATSVHARVADAVRPMGLESSLHPVERTEL